MTRSVPPPTTLRPTGARLSYVDNLRIALTVVVVLHHAAVAYSTIPQWYYKEPTTDPSATLLDLFAVVNQSYFMGAFFLLSGLFVPASLDRKGPGRFLADRLLRLGVPLLVWLFVLRALVTVDRYQAERATALARGADLPYWQYYLQSFSAGPMWFVEVLLLFSALYVLWRWLVPARAVAVTGRAPGAAAIIGFTAALALVTYLWRIVLPMDSNLLGLPSPGYLPQYAALFAVGVLAARRGWLGSVSRAAGRVGLAAAVVGVVVLLAMVFGSSDEEFMGHGSWQSLVAVTGESVFAVGIVLWLLVLFRGRFDRQGRGSRFLSAHAFTVYLIHPVVLVGLSHLIVDVPVPAVGKFVLLSVLAVPLCWLVAYPVRALPGLRKVL